MVGNRQTVEAEFLFRLEPPVQIERTVRHMDAILTDRQRFRVAPVPQHVQQRRGFAGETVADVRADLREDAVAELAQVGDLAVHGEKSVVDADHRLLLQQLLAELVFVDLVLDEPDGFLTLRGRCRHIRSLLSPKRGGNAPSRRRSCT